MFPTYGQINLFKKWIKSNKYADFGQAGKISVQLDDECYKTKNMLKSEKITIIFVNIWTEEWKLS